MIAWRSSVWYLPTLMQVAEPEDGPKLMRNPFSQSAQALSYNPILFFNEFVRNLAPNFQSIHLPMTIALTS